MFKWKLHDAKNKLSQLIETALKGEPQYITRRGKEEVVIISIEEYKKLVKPTMPLNNFLLTGPKFDDLEIVRVRGNVRKDI